MFSAKLLFALLIITCIIFYIMYLWDFALVLLVVMTALPLAMLITTFIASRMIDVELLEKDDTAVKKENFPIQIKIDNHSIFPIGKAEAHIEYSNMFGGEVGRFVVHMPIQALNSQSVSFRLSSKYCGVISIKCEQIYIYDPLRIFRFRAGRNVHTEVAVMPEGHEISGEVCYTDKVNDESSAFSEYKPGDDPSEIFDLRGYNPGDKLNRIHWKLSSKKDEFIVKDYSLPVDIPCTLFLDLSCKNDDYALPITDTLIETLVSVSQFLTENERVHTVVYYSCRMRGFTEKTIDSPDTLAALINELILSADSGESIKTPLDYFVEHEDMSVASFVFISAETEPKTMTFINECIDAELKNALIAVRSEDEGTAMDAFPEICTIPVVMGRISSSIRDIEV